MPEKIEFIPPIKKKAEDDITKGEVFKDGRILSWKSDSPIEPVIEKSKEETSEVIATQKAANVEPPKGNYFYGGGRDKTPRRQEMKEAEI